MQENPNEPSKEKEVDRESEKFQSAKLFFEENYWLKLVSITESDWNRIPVEETDEYYWWSKRRPLPNLDQKLL